MGSTKMKVAPNGYLKHIQGEIDDDKAMLMGESLKNR
jgi:hypothetical protein